MRVVEQQLISNYGDQTNSPRGKVGVQGVRNKAVVCSEAKSEKKNANFLRRPISQCRFWAPIVNYYYKRPCWWCRSRTSIKIMASGGWMDGAEGLINPLSLRAAAKRQTLSLQCNRGKSNSFLQSPPVASRSPHKP